MKKIFYIKLSVVILLIFMCTQSCSDKFLLQENPNAVVPESYWSTEDEALKGVFGCYDAFSDISYYSRMIIFLSDYRDDIINPYVASGRTQIARFDDIGDNDINKWVWSNMWTCIARSNEAIVKLPDVPDLDVETLNSYLGEVYFIRALNYFNVLLNWLHIPMPLSTEEANGEPNQVEPWRVWNQIVEDLKEAQRLAPVSWPEGNEGRATSGAATAMLGKAYLYRATLYKEYPSVNGIAPAPPDPAPNPTQEYTNAKTEFNKLINGTTYGTYRLVDHYGDNFSNHVDAENNEESLFEIQLIKDANIGWGNVYATMSRCNNINEDIAPSAYNTEDGMSVNEWVLDVFTEERTVDGGFDPRAYVTLFWNTDEYTIHDDDTLRSVFYEGDTYRDAYPDVNENRVWGKKYCGVYDLNDVGEPFVSASFFQNSSNFRVLRYADVLLMHAEADFYLNGPTAAEGLSAINTVRARVQMPELTELNFDAIDDERVRELTFEHTRYFDLLRWGLVKERIVETPDIKSNCGGVGAYQDGREWMALPSSELSLFPNWGNNIGY